MRGWTYLTIVKTLYVRNLITEDRSLSQFGWCGVRDPEL
jgi:hypothetical protein